MDSRNDDECERGDHIPEWSPPLGTWEEIGDFDEQAIEVDDAQAPTEFERVSVHLDQNERITVAVEDTADAAAVSLEILALIDKSVKRLHQAVINLDTSVGTLDKSVKKMATQAETSSKVMVNLTLMLLILTIILLVVAVLQVAQSCTTAA